MPERVQLRRTKGWRKPPGAVVVARPSKWGNPHRVGDTIRVSGLTEYGLAFSTKVVVTVELAVTLFRAEWLERLDTHGSQHSPVLAYVARNRAELDELRGHDLACWCPLDQPCHADVLLELANQSADV